MGLMWGIDLGHIAGVTANEVAKRCFAKGLGFETCGRNDAGRLGQTEQIEPAEFGILPPMLSGGTVSLMVQLAPTGTATTSIDIPAVQ